VRASFRTTIAATGLWALLLLLVLTGCGSAVALQSAPPAGTADTHLGPGIGGALVVEPDAGARPVIRALDRAQQSIFVEAYILSNRRVIRALERAAAQSVGVHVLLDPRALGMGLQPQHVADELKAAGVAVRWTSPAFPLTHAKLMILDDRMALISTANFSLAGLSADRDFIILDRNARDVHELDALVRADWDRTATRVNAPNLVIAPASARAKLQTLAQSATQSLDIYGEEMNDPGFERVLAKIACRGVTVRVLLPAAPVTGAPVYRKGCVHIRVLKHPYVHAKVILVDGGRGFLGSENMSRQSLDRNREVGVLVRGVPVRRLAQVFERDWRRSLSVPQSGS
jgi:phosphatidylserine/phosphatidylglycerophosphate/cardiolipin synthase-like enzyme